ncbi:unnamed protein product [Effrenium voratum]|nr:unnamed protein product [Effrenium voratum]
MGCCGSFRTRLKRCCRRGCRRIWAAQPKRLQEAVESVLGKAYFALVCARWAVNFFWEDRQELLADAKAAVQDTWRLGQVPTSQSQVYAELQPFRWALMAGLAYCSWDMVLKVLRSSAMQLES